MYKTHYVYIVTPYFLIVCSRQCNFFKDTISYLFPSVPLISTDVRLSYTIVHVYINVSIYENKNWTMHKINMCRTRICQYIITHLSKHCSTDCCFSIVIMWANWKSCWFPFGSTIINCLSTTSLHQFTPGTTFLWIQELRNTHKEKKYREPPSCRSNIDYCIFCCMVPLHQASMDI